MWVIADPFVSVRSQPYLINAFHKCAPQGHSLDYVAILGRVNCLASLNCAVKLCTMAVMNKTAIYPESDFMILF